MNTNVEIKFQIGKAGLSEEVIKTLDGLLKIHKKIRIAVLPSCPEHSRDKIGSLAKALEEKLIYECSTKIIGYTILLRRMSVNPKAPQKTAKAL